MNRAGSLGAVTAAHVTAGGWRLGERVEPGPRMVRTPLAESGTIGLGAGLALAGQRVIVELVEAAGLERAADAMGDIASVRSRSTNAWSAPIVVRVPLRVSDVRPAVPRGWTVGVATGEDDAAAMLAHALSSADPTVIFLAACPEGAVAAVGLLAAGVPVVRREGTAVTVLAEGSGVSVALAAAALLDAEGLSVEVVDLRGATADAPLVAERVARTGRVVHVGHGEGDMLAGALVRAFWSLESPPAALAASAGSDALVRLVRATLEA